MRLQRWYTRPLASISLHLRSSEDVADAAQILRRLRHEEDNSATDDDEDGVLWSTVTPREGGKPTEAMNRRPIPRTARLIDEAWMYDQKSDHWQRRLMSIVDCGLVVFEIGWPPAERVINLSNAAVDEQKELGMLSGGFLIYSAGLKVGGGRHGGFSLDATGDDLL